MLKWLQEGLNQNLASRATLRLKQIFSNSSASTPHYKSLCSVKRPFSLGFVGSITSRCSGKEPALLPQTRTFLEEGRPDTRERRKSSLCFADFEIIATAALLVLRKESKYRFCLPLACPHWHNRYGPVTRANLIVKSI